MSEEFLTISQLNQYIKDVVSAGFPQPLWVCGEIQRISDRGHMYFNLVEKEEDSASPKAEIQAVLWANRKDQILKKLKESDDEFELKNDIEVKFQCRVSFYDKRGTVSLHVEDVDPYYTLGKIAQEKQKLIALLKKKGILDQNKILELPVACLNIGLITAEGSAAYNDFLSELKKSGFGFSVYHINAAMQGKKTEKDICSALGKMQKLKELDCIIITRGGGSKTDLSWFDSQPIAEKIAGSKLPVLTGIGHEIDISVTDLAAHTYAKTPTAIAQVLIRFVEEVLEKLDTYLQDVVRESMSLLDNNKQSLRNNAFTLQQETNRYLKDHHQHISKSQEAIKQAPLAFCKYQRQKLSTETQSLRRTALIKVKADRQKVSHLSQVIELVHPQNTLKRGFSIIRNKKKKTLKYIADVAPKEIVQAQLFDGTFSAVVGDVNDNKDLF